MVHVIKNVERWKIEARRKEWMEQKKIKPKKKMGEKEKEVVRGILDH